MSFLKHYAWLAAHYLTHGLGVYWQIVPKFHYFMHIALQSSNINPRQTSTYIDESYVGRICDVYKACLSGPHANTVQRTVLSKWLMGVAAMMANMA